MERNETVSSRSSRLLVAALSGAGLCLPLAQTLVVGALPVLARHYRLSPAEAAWILTAVLLAASVATPVIGALAASRDRAKLLMAVLALFAVGTVVCAIGRSLPMLLAGRTLQGLSAGVYPLAFSLIRDKLPAQDVSRAVAVVGATFGVGAGVGLCASGAIAAYLPIAWVFLPGLVAVPVMLMLQASGVTDVRFGAPGSMDWGGAWRLAAALAAVLIGVTRAGALGWTAPQTLLLLAAGVLAGVAFARHEARVAAPLVQLSTLRHPAVATANVVGALAGGCLLAGFLLLPALSVSPASSGVGLGTTVAAGGVLLVPFSCAQLAGGWVVAPVTARIGADAALGAGAALIAGAFAGLALRHGSRFDLLVGGGVLGLGVALAYGAMTDLIIATVTEYEVGVATGLNTVARMMGGALGSVITSAMLAASAPGGLHPSEAGFVHGFWLASGGGVVAALLVMAMSVVNRRAVQA